MNYDKCLEYRINNLTPFFIIMLNRRPTMKLNEFIKEFAETHSVQHIDDIDGIIISAITQDLYLVNNKELTE